MDNALLLGVVGTVTGLVALGLHAYRELKERSLLRLQFEGTEREEGSFIIRTVLFNKGRIPTEVYDAYVYGLNPFGDIPASTEIIRESVGSIGRSYSVVHINKNKPLKIPFPIHPHQTMKIAFTVPLNDKNFFAPPNTLRRIKIVLMHTYGELKREKSVGVGIMRETLWDRFVYSLKDKLNM